MMTFVMLGGDAGASWYLARRTLGLGSSSPEVQVGGLLTMPPEDTGADRSALPDLD